MRAAVGRPGPVWPNLPTPNAFLPLVVLLAVLLPGLYTWSYGRLTDELAAWGLYGLQICRGDWWLPGASDAPVPPMYAWSTALASALPVSQKFWLPLLPSYLYGLLGLAGVYWLGRLWLTPGTGLLACLLVALNGVFLEHIQRGDGSTCVFFWAVVSLLGHAYHLRAQAETLSPSVFLRGFGFAGLLLCAGSFAMWFPVIAFLSMQFPQSERRMDIPASLRASFSKPGVHGGLLAMVIGLLVAAPWLLLSGWHAGPFAPWRDPLPLAATTVLSWTRLLGAMPTITVLAGFGLWRSACECIKASPASSRSALPLFWTLIMLLVLRTVHPTYGCLLVLVVPVNLLAIKTLFEILRRELRDSTVFVLMFLCGGALVVARSELLQNMPQWLFDFRKLSASQLLDLHLAADGLILIALLVNWLQRWTQRRDRDRRLLFGAFILGTLFSACFSGLTGTETPKRRDDPWLTLYRQLEAEGRFDQVILVGEQRPNDSLLYTLQMLYPDLPLTRLGRLGELAVTLSPGNARPLVLVTDTTLRLLKRTVISRGDHTLTLRQIHQSDQVIAYAPE